MSEDQIIDPSFHMPAGVKGFRYSEPTDFGYLNEPGGDIDEYMDPAEFGDPDEISYYGGEMELDGSGDTYPPDYILVVSQEVKTWPGGGQVVDVVLELPDLEEGSKYDIKVTKG